MSTGPDEVGMHGARSRRHAAVVLLAMRHLRIVSPPEHTESVLTLLRAVPAVTGLTLLPGASLVPVGDLVRPTARSPGTVSRLLAPRWHPSHTRPTIRSGQRHSVGTYGRGRAKPWIAFTQVRDHLPRGECGASWNRTSDLTLIRGAL
jgi:hypothetical protein